MKLYLLEMDTLHGEVLSELVLYMPRINLWLTNNGYSNVHIEQDSSVGKLASKDNCNLTYIGNI